MNKFVRTLWATDARPLWSNEAERENLRRYLNALGFYVLTGQGDALDVYVTEDAEPVDIRAAKKVLDKLANTIKLVIGG